MHRNNNCYTGQYSQCGIVNADIVYQHSVDADHTYHHRGNGNRNSHRITGRSYGSMGG